MFCSMCGVKNPEVARFCYSCGAKLVEKAMPGPGPAPEDLPGPEPKPPVIIPPKPSPHIDPEPHPQLRKKWSPWEPLNTLQAARKVALRGSYTCFVITALSVFVVIMIYADALHIPNVVNPQPILVEAAFMAYAGWQIRARMSRGWAITALTLYCLDAVVSLMAGINQGFLKIVFILFLVEAVRGTLAYHRLSMEGQPPPAPGTQPLPGPVSNNPLSQLWGKLSLSSTLPHVVHRTPQESRQRRLLAIAAGLGCGFSILFVQGVTHILEQRKAVEFLLVAGLMLLATMTFVEPLIQWVCKSWNVHVDHPLLQESQKKIQLAVLGISFGVIVLHNVIHESINENVIGSIASLAVSILIPGLITLAWVDGVRETPARSMIRGGRRAFVLGALVMMCFWAATGGSLPTGTEQPSVQQAAYTEAVQYQPSYSPQGTNTTGMVSAPITGALLVALVNGIGWALLGLAGGYALDKQWGAKRTTTLLAVLVATAFVAGILASSFPTSTIQDFFHQLAQGAGWGLGLVLYRPAEAFLRREPALEAAAPLPSLPSAT